MTRPARGAPRAATAQVLAVLAVLTALAPLSVDIYTPSLPTIQAELGGDEWLAQASITACLLGLGLGQLLWGPLSDRLGRRPVILAGVIGWTAASALSAFADSSAMLIVARLLAGLCGAACIAVSRSVVRDLSENASLLSSRIGMLATVTAVAPVLAPVAGAAIAVAWGWRADFVVLAALGCVITLLCAAVLPETLPPAGRAGAGTLGVGASLGLAVRNTELAGIALALGAHAVGFYAYITTTSFIVERQLGHPPVVFALVFGTNAVAMLSANLLFRRLVQGHHPSLPLGVGLAASAAAGVALFAVAASNGPVLMMWACSMLFAAGSGFVLPGAHSWGQLTIVVSGAASALTGAAQFLGGVLGSPVTGMIGPTATTLGAVMALASGCGLLAWDFARRHMAARTAQ